MTANQCRALFGIACLYAIAVPGTAQTFRGSIAGGVADSTGAAIPGASISIVNAGTGLTRSLVTTGSGDFTFPDLPPGKYDVTVAAKGFQTQKIEGLDVPVGKVASLNLTLPLATQQE